MGNETADHRHRKLKKELSEIAYDSLLKDTQIIHSDHSFFLGEPCRKCLDQQQNLKDNIFSALALADKENEK